MGDWHHDWNQNKYSPDPMHESRPDPRHTYKEKKLDNKPHIERIMSEETAIAPVDEPRLTTTGSGTAVLSLNDGGSRKTYNTGAQKEDDSKCEGKGAYHLLPQHPIRRVSEIYRKGAIKYAARNWEKGIPISRVLDSAQRHLAQFVEGMEDEDHLHQAIWNLFAISHYLEMIRRGILPAELNDLPSYGVNGIPVEVRPGYVVDKWRAKGEGCE